jgi:hypothetical protein
MNTKTISVISLMTAFAVTLMMSQTAFAGISPPSIPDYLVIDDISVIKGDNPPKGTWEIHIELAGPIPEEVSASDNFGWAVIGTKGAVVGAIHPVADDSVAQPPLDEPHTHKVIPEETEDCDSGVAIGSASKNQVGKMTISEDRTKVWITHIPKGLVGDLDEETAFAFTLSLENDRVCINPVVPEE